MHSIRLLAFPIPAANLNVDTDRVGMERLAATTPAARLFCFADGHVTFVSDNVDSTAYEAAATYAGSETVAEMN